MTEDTVKRLVKGAFFEAKYSPFSLLLTRRYADLSQVRTPHKELAIFLKDLGTQFDWLNIADMVQCKCSIREDLNEDDSLNYKALAHALETQMKSVTLRETTNSYELLPSFLNSVFVAAARNGTGKYIISIR